MGKHDYQEEERRRTRLGRRKRLGRTAEYWRMGPTTATTRRLGAAATAARRLGTAATRWLGTNLTKYWRLGTTTTTTRWMGSAAAASKYRRMGPTTTTTRRLGTAATTATAARRLWTTRWKHWLFELRLSLGKSTRWRTMAASTATSSTILSCLHLNLRRCQVH